MTDEEIPLNIADEPRREDDDELTDTPFPEGLGDPTDGTEDEVPSTESDSPAEEEDGVEPVEYLVQLAKEGEIDPWDIDIVAVTEEFLAALDDGDLRASGRALFYASVLLRMKSDTLLSDGEPEEADAPEPWEQALEAPAEDAPGPAIDPIDGLEAEIERRLQRKTVRGKPETLDELVRELRDAERDSWWKRSREYDTSESPEGYQRGTQELDYHGEDGFRAAGEPTESEALGNTHSEDIETIIDEVWVSLSDHYEAGRSEVLYAEVDRAGGSRVMTYLALLFLANRGRVYLDQTELFGDLWVQDPDSELVTESSPSPLGADD
jgi:segregation and condensation protein A